MRRVFFPELLVLSGCAASAPPAEAPMVAIPSAAPAAQESTAPPVTTADPGRDARVLAALETHGDVEVAQKIQQSLYPQRPDPVRLGAGGSLHGLHEIGTFGVGTHQPRLSVGRGQATIGSTAAQGGTVSNAEKVVTGMAAGFRRCFNKGLAADPKMQGSVTLTLNVDTNGEVTSSVPSKVNGLSADVVSCVAARAAVAQFAPPNGGPAVLVVPITFVP